jgi:uncharacterized DUF497 family protein
LQNSKPRPLPTFHGVNFDEAKEVFEDPLAVYKLERIENGEERWQIVGMCQRFLLLLVVHTSRETDDKEIVRIISARELETWERKEFEYGTRH